jgi:8-oxo-dGTP diphosphatase
MLIAYKRDDKLGIPYPGLWDLPGGGREGDETPVECALRELEEEFSIRIEPERIHWSREYPGLTPEGTVTYLFVGTVTKAEIEAIRFGDEGERWEMITIDAFITRPDAPSHLQNRLRDYLNETGWDLGAVAWVERSETHRSVGPGQG